MHLCSSLKILNSYSFINQQKYIRAIKIDFRNIPFVFIFQYLHAKGNDL